MGIRILYAVLLYVTSTWYAPSLAAESEGTGLVAAKLSECLHQDTCKIHRGANPSDGRTAYQVGFRTAESYIIIISRPSHLSRLEVYWIFSPYHSTTMIDTDLDGEVDHVWDIDGAVKKVWIYDKEYAIYTGAQSLYEEALRLAQTILIAPIIKKAE